MGPERKRVRIKHTENRLSQDLAIAKDTQIPHHTFLKDRTPRVCSGSNKLPDADRIQTTEAHNALGGRIFKARCLGCSQVFTYVRARGYKGRNHWALSEDQSWPPANAM